MKFIEVSPGVGIHVDWASYYPISINGAHVFSVAETVLLIEGLQKAIEFVRNHEREES